MSYFLIHNANSDKVLVSAYLLDEKTIKIVCAISYDYLQSVEVLWKYRYDCNADFYHKNCHSIYRGNVKSIWECVINVWKCDINFIVKVEGKTYFWHSEIGCHKNKEEAIPFAFTIPMIREKDYKRYLPQLPHWLNGCTFYEIFVDRYRKHKETIGSYSWQTRPPTNDFYHHAIYGGTLQGIIHAIIFDGQYLKKMGIGGIYLTPVFTSPSNHKYDTEDYFSIDNSFGSKEDMINLVEVAHENNIKVVLDGVFNHCSEKIRIQNNRGKVIHLVDEIKKCGKETPYYYWFEWETNEKWRGFANLLHIPILNTSNEDCVAYLLNVIEYWTKLIDVDGWRLDVANELGDTFIKNIQNVLSSKFSNKWLLGEILHNGEHWLDNELLSGITNHHWHEIVIKFITGKWCSTEFVEHLLSLWLRYPSTFYKGVINYLSNHDTARIMTQIESEQNYDEKISKCIISVVLLFTSLGTPMVYYGDEIGMEGNVDPDCRRCMEWDENYWEPFKKEGREKLRNVYSCLIHFRRENKWLADGIWQILLQDDSQLLIYKRYNSRSIDEVCKNTEEIIVIVNPSYNCFDVNIKDFLRYEHYTDVLSGDRKAADSLQQICVKPFSSTILYGKDY